MAQTAAVPISMDTWIVGEDYPRDEVRDDAEIPVTAILDVDDRGMVRGCIVDKAGRAPVLEELTCKLLRKRARFHPAIAANGKPVASSVSKSVTWRTPAALITFAEPYSIVNRIRLAEGGAVIDCRTSKAGATEGEFDYCRKVGAKYPALAQLRLNEYAAGLLTVVFSLQVEGSPFAASPGSDASSDIPPFGEQRTEMTIDANGKVTQCRRFRSDTGAYGACSHLYVFNPEPSQPIRKIVMLESYAFQPDK